SGLLQVKPTLAAALNQELGREASAELPFPQDAALPPSPPPAPIIEARLRTKNPDLEAAEHLIEGQRKDIELAKKARYPEIAVGMAYGFKRDMKQRRGLSEGLDALNAGRKLYADPTSKMYTDILVDATRNRVFQESENVDDEIMLTLKMNLPIYHKRIKAGIEQAQIMEKSVRQRQAQQTLTLGAEAQMALNKYLDGARRLDIYRGTLIPKAKLTYDTIQSSYTTGADVVFLDLLESERSLLEFQLAEAMAVRDLQTAAADLERIMGGPWSEEPAPATPTPLPTDSKSSAETPEPK
ncbi:MAG: TolC family protein, partial [Candidatus Hydrogenedentes bacterium]|nr:TolC family protein [Candidatus Hydrogenedentota bacterium]